ncbi:hypothetical protein [Oscillibacter sp.]|uniref:hypothetical protein n=1 Tax=Oscillibacter sp. TaxID=1945593 RepID=UPI0028AB375F|nr:hypothetical protein [Oscillibacter sp.]
MKMIKQRLWGLALILISVALMALASTGETPEERDATAVLLTLPLGIYALVTKEDLLCAPAEAAHRVRAGPRRKRLHVHRRTRRPQGSGHYEQIEKGVSLWQEHVS